MNKKDITIDSILNKQDLDRNSKNSGASAKKYFSASTSGRKLFNEVMDNVIQQSLYDNDTDANSHNLYLFDPSYGKADIRFEKINNITAQIEKGAYNPDFNMIAQKLLSPDIVARI